MDVGGRRVPRVSEADREQGSVTVFVAITGMALIVMMGLAVDGGGQIRANQEAQAIAAEAARAGGQQIEVGGAMVGQSPVVDPSAAVAAANAYLAGVPDVTGTASVNGGRVVVDTTTTYQTVVLGIIGIDSLTATGHAEVQITRAVDGVTR